MDSWDDVLRTADEAVRGIIKDKMNVEAKHTVIHVTIETDGAIVCVARASESDPLLADSLRMSAEEMDNDDLGIVYDA